MELLIGAANMKDQKLAELCVPVGLAHGGRGMFTCPSDLIGRIRKLQRYADLYRKLPKDILELTNVDDAEK